MRRKSARQNFFSKQILKLDLWSRDHEAAATTESMGQ
jgi:hypothetical protein